ncbi:MAG TPA: cobalamin-binding protein [Burkholderiaceae bacterium]|nr:cobalamin-binding protein [Burkholderiaceae bacterium]
MRAFALVVAASLALAVMETAAARVTVVDDEGRAVELARPALRIVSLAPHLTEQLFAIGAGDLIVGTTDFADFPAAAAGLPRVARAHSVDLERVSAARPDLILVWGSGFPPATIDAVRRLGVPTFVSEPARLADIATSLERLGTLTARPADRAAGEFKAKLAALRERYRGRREVRVFYQVWSDPLMTLGGRHVISEALAVCGGRNVFADLTPIAPRVSTEAVLAVDPEVIITAEPGGKPSAALTAWKRFERLTAVKRNQLITLDADRMNRHGPRILDETESMCAAIDRAR